MSNKIVANVAALTQVEDLMLVRNVRPDINLRLKLHKMPGKAGHVPELKMIGDKMMKKNGAILTCDKSMLWPVPFEIMWLLHF